MRKSILATAALLVVVAMSAFGGSPAVADTQPGTHVDSLNTTLSANSISVTGTASFVAVPLLVSEDGTGDATPAGVGADIDVATVNRPVGTNNLVFKMTIADMLAGPVFAAPNVTHMWPLAVNGEDKGYFLMAGRAGGGFSPTANATTSLMQDGSGGFSTIARLSGTFGPAEVSWTLGLNRIQGKTGDTISLGGGAPGGSWLGMVETFYGLINYDSFGADDFVVPGAQVSFGIAPAGTPPELVELTTNATSVNATTGAFSGALPKPAPGSYILVAKACYSVDNCGLMSRDITI